MRNEEFSSTTEVSKRAGLEQVLSSHNARSGGEGMDDQSRSRVVLGVRGLIVLICLNAYGLGDIDDWEFV